MEIKLDGNDLTSVGDVFPRQLISLGLSGNEMSTVSPDAFQNLTSLLTLDLSLNNLEEIPALPSSLIMLWLTDNSISLIPRNKFSGFKKLTYVDFSSVTITAVEAGAFNGLT